LPFAFTAVTRFCSHVSLAALTFVTVGCTFTAFCAVAFTFCYHAPLPATCYGSAACRLQFLRSTVLVTGCRTTPLPGLPTFGSVVVTCVLVTHTFLYRLPACTVTTTLDYCQFRYTFVPGFAVRGLLPTFAVTLYLGSPVTCLPLPVVPRLLVLRITTVPACVRARAFTGLLRFIRYRFHALRAAHHFSLPLRFTTFARYAVARLVCLLVPRFSSTVLVGSCHRSSGLPVHARCACLVHALLFWFHTHTYAPQFHWFCLCYRWLRLPSGLRSVHATYTLRLVPHRAPRGLHATRPPHTRATRLYAPRAFWLVHGWFTVLPGSLF